MDTMQAFLRAQQAERSGARGRVFDWNKAARLIAEHRPEYANAGLAEDWANTEGEIWSDEQPQYSTYAYLSSIWATPTLDMDGEWHECWVYQDETPSWRASTRWPEESLNILNN